MTTFDAKLLSPPPQEEERDPYRPVWRTTAFEVGFLVAGALAINLFASVLDVRLEAGQRPPATAILSLAPLGLWLLFSWRGERKARQPRAGLPALLLVSALVANAVTAPFVEDVIAPDTWLNTQSGLVRILGYALTVGLAYEFSKYLVLRYMAWPRRFVRRIDCVAYSLTISLAFATVFNLRYALFEGGGQPGAAAIHIAATVLVHQGVGLVVAYRLMALKFGKSSMISLAASLLAASGLIGFYTAFRAGLTAGSFGIGSTGNTPLLGFAFSVAFGVILFGLIGFLISVADARDARASGFGRR